MLTLIRELKALALIAWYVVGQQIVAAAIVVALFAGWYWLCG